MRRRTIVYIACSPHARTGVSTTARLLTDYNLLQRRPVAGFDTDPHEPFYGAIFSKFVRMVDINDVKGQISLFDSLLVENEVPKIVDVWYRSYRKFFAMVKEIGFFEEARRVGVDPVVLFQADATGSALADAMALRVTWPDLRMIVVHNEGAAALGDHAHEILRHYPVGRKFVIAPLDPSVARFLQDTGFSLSSFLIAPPPDMSIVVRAALKAWMTPVFTQFLSYELRATLEDALYLR
jgi:hypothetical protein